MGNFLRISYGTSRDQKSEGAGSSSSPAGVQVHQLPPDFVDRLDLKNQNLTDLPKDFIVEELTWLSLNHNAIESLPPEIARLTRLTIFRLFGNKLRTLPPEIGALSHLTTLDVGKNLLTSLPPQIGALSLLKGGLHIRCKIAFCFQIDYENNANNAATHIELHVHWNRLENILPEVGQLTALHTLNLYINRLTSLPDELKHLTALENLDIAHNAFSTVEHSCPLVSICSPPFLTSNTCFMATAAQLPDVISHLSALTHLKLVGNDFKTLGTELSHSVALQKLDLRCNFLTGLPPEIGNLTSLRYLLLRNNCIASLPAEIGQLHELLELSLGNNQLTVPQFAWQLKTNCQFSNTLSNCAAQCLPPEIAGLSNLRNLDLWENKCGSSLVSYGPTASYLASPGFWSCPT